MEDLPARCTNNPTFIQSVQTVSTTVAKRLRRVFSIQDMSAAWRRSQNKAIVYNQTRCTGQQGPLVTVTQKKCHSQNSASEVTTLWRYTNLFIIIIIIIIIIILDV